MYKRLKKYIALLLCCTILITSVAHQQKEVKAIAPAIPIVVIGAIALGGGVYFANKDDLQSMASDCMDWLKDNVLDAYNDAVNLVANGGKYIVSGVLTSGVYAYLKHKYGWGSTDTPVTSATRDLATVNAPIKELINSSVNAFTQYGFAPSFSVNNWISNNGMYYLTVRSRAVSGYDFYYDFHAFNPVVTDIVLKSYSSLWGWKFLLFDSFGNEVAFTDFLKDYMLLGCGVGKNESRNYTGDFSSLRNIVENYLIDYYGNLTWKERCEKVSSNHLGFPAGIRFWGSEEAYKNNLTNTKDYYGVTPGQSINVDIGYNTALQTPDTAIPVQTVGDMTVEEFITATGDLANDDTVGWQQVIEHLTGSSDNDNDDDNDNENKDPIGGDFIIPGLGIQWFTDLADKVGSIPQTIKDSISDLFLRFEFAYEDFKEWLASEIKAIPTNFKASFTSVIDSIKDIPTSFADYFHSVVDAVNGIDFPTFPSLTDITSGVLAIPGYIQALPGQFADWFERVISGIQAIPGEFTNWFDNIIDKLTELCEVVSNIFVVDTTQIDFATFADVAQGKFNIIKQLDYVVDEVRKIKPSNDIPVIYIKTPPQFKPFITDSEIIFVDLRPYKPFFDFCRVTLEAFVWFWVFRYLFKKFDLTITITP